MFKINARYWICQVMGWGGWSMLNLFIAYQFLSEVYLTPEAKRDVFFYNLAIDFAWSILATHFLRLVLKRINWMRFSINRVVIMFIIGVSSAGLVLYYGATTTAHTIGKSFDDYSNNERLQKAEKMESEANLANTDYYLFKKLAGGDSSEVNASLRIKKATGWQRDEKGKWNYEEPMKGRKFWSYMITFILVAL
jgi:hypothetical protein